MTTPTPHILIIMTDQQHAGMLGCAGNEHLATPAMDRLAAEGVRFTRAYCTDPVCLPSRVSMMTGMMPCRLGAGNNSLGATVTIPPEVVDRSLGRLAEQAGYHTIYSGKVHLSPGLEPTRSGFAVQTMDEQAGLPDECLAAIDKRGDKPFFAIASLINPHDICFAHLARHGEDRHGVLALYRQAAALDDDALPPLPENFAIQIDEPAALAERLDAEAVTPTGLMRQEYTERDWRIYRWIYHRLTETVDAEVGRLLDGLDARGLTKDTLIIFLSDHGNMDGAHQLASKSVFYEESVGVPCIMRLPGAIPAGRVDDRLVSTGLDLVPTLCDYMGGTVPAELLGRSLRPLAEAQDVELWRTFVPAENEHSRMIRTERYKYCSYGRLEEEESLVDLDADPGELVNCLLDDAHVEGIAEVRAYMSSWGRLSQDRGCLHFLR